MKVLFIEPPKDFWFVMGEYLPPPLGILQLASYLENRNKNVEIEVLDSQAERIDWKSLERRIEKVQPDIVAPSSLATCNTYTVIRTLETVKSIDPHIVTVVGGQHFTATAIQSLEDYSSIDIVVRGEGEETFAAIVETLETKKSLSRVRGITFKKKEKIIQTPDRPLIENLDDLPFPGYHYVADNIKKYHFKMMVGANTPYALIEASRGCLYQCSFCSQWKFWRGTCRAKSSTRIVDEIDMLYSEFGIPFFWLTDDNFSLERTGKLCDEIIQRRLSDNIMWFIQARTDDIQRNKNILPKVRKAGVLWILTGLESGSKETLSAFRKEINPLRSKESINLLKRNDIFAQATLIIGERKDSHETIRNLREFVNDVDPDLAIFMILTPFPGTELFKLSEKEGWIEDTNWSHYDMLHAIMPTETLSRFEVQEELYECYRNYYGSFRRRLSGLFSPNALKRRTYRYLASQGLLKALRDLF